MAYVKRKSSEKRLKMEDINIAMELGYPKKVIWMLDDEDDPEKRQRILTDARKGVYDK